MPSLKATATCPACCLNDVNPCSNNPTFDLKVATSLDDGSAVVLDCLMMIWGCDASTGGAGGGGANLPSGDDAIT